MIRLTKGTHRGGVVIAGAAAVLGLGAFAGGALTLAVMGARAVR